MHSHTLDDWRHDHVFLGDAHDRNERRTWLVVGLTATMMVAEIAGGTLFGSMALLADGWHMSTHAGALAIAAFAYRFARRHARDPRFAFGTGKLGDLAGFASAVAARADRPDDRLRIADAALPARAIHYRRGDRHRRVGLAVNLLSAWLLGAGHDHITIMTTIMATIITTRPQSARRLLPCDGRRAHLGAGDRGLLAAWVYGWTWLDPAIGVVGALVIAHWSWRLIREAGAVLLDAAPDRGAGRRRSASASRSATTASPTCMSGAWSGPSCRHRLAGVRCAPAGRALQGAARRPARNSATSRSKSIAATTLTDMPCLIVVRRTTTAAPNALSHHRSAAARSRSSCGYPLR